MIALLVTEYGADVSYALKSRNLQENVELLRFLMEHGLDVHATNDDGKTLMEVVQKRLDNPHTVEDYKEKFRTVIKYLQEIDEPPPVLK
jgi:hypothetical protein